MAFLFFFVKTAVVNVTTSSREIHFRSRHARHHRCNNSQLDRRMDQVRSASSPMENGRWEKKRRRRKKKKSVRNIIQRNGRITRTTTSPPFSLRLRLPPPPYCPHSRLRWLLLPAAATQHLCRNSTSSSASTESIQQRRRPRRPPSASCNTWQFRKVRVMTIILSLYITLSLSLSLSSLRSFVLFIHSRPYIHSGLREREKNKTNKRDCLRADRCCGAAHLREQRDTPFRVTIAVTDRFNPPEIILRSTRHPRVITSI